MKRMKWAVALNTTILSTVLIMTISSPRLAVRAGAMNHLIVLVSLAGILSTAVVFGADMFFLTVGRPALRLASQSAGTEVMGFIHVFGDARMPIWGTLAILSNLVLAPFSRSGHRGFYLLSLSMLILFVVIYGWLSKPINRLQTEAAKTGRRLDNARELQASWDRSVMIRIPLLVASLLAQCLALLATSTRKLVDLHSRTTRASSSSELALRLSEPRME